MSKIIKNFDKIKYGPAPEDSKEVYNWINKFLNGEEMPQQFEFVPVPNNKD